MSSTRKRRLDGWGFIDQTYPPSDALLNLLHARIGVAEAVSRQEVKADSVPAPRRVPDMGIDASSEALDRLTHSRGKGLSDLIRLRTQTVSRLPDAIVRPSDAAQVVQILAAADKGEVRVIPFGGGTSVTGGVNVTSDEDRAVVVLDLERMSGLHDVDPISRLATFGAGTTGPAVEASLASHGLTLGHFPQSWELSTVGGWVVTRASGQQSLGYGSIRDMFAGGEVVSPAGSWSIPNLPASASGPDVREMLLGSEGRLGIVTKATLRLSTRPETTDVRGMLMPSFPEGVDAVRKLIEHRVPLSLVRLSDENETEVAMSVGLASHTALAPIVRRWFQFRGIQGNGCILMYGATGSQSDVDGTLGVAQSVLRKHGGLSLGASPGQHWLKDRFRHPYLRDGLLDRGYATDTLETSAPWSRVHVVADATRKAISESLSHVDERVHVLCHVSHPYSDGCSLYFILFYRNPADPEEAIERWAVVKRAATDAIAKTGGAISHHHGIGSWHAPWYEQEVGPMGKRLVQAIAKEADPKGILNPGSLLDSTDRLTV